MSLFKKGDRVVSKQSGNRGFIDKVEFDESFHCLMYRVDMQGNVYYIEGKRNDGVYFWFKANDLASPDEFVKQDVPA